MNLIISIILGLAIGTFAIFLLQLLTRILKHLKIIRLQLEIQNPMFTSEELLDLDKNIQYWQEKMFKFKHSDNEKMKDIGDITFKLFWAYVDRLNHVRVIIVEAKHGGDPTKIHDKYREWLNKNEAEIDDLEKKAETLDGRIKEDLDHRSLDYEFLGKWGKDES